MSPAERGLFTRKELEPRSNVGVVFPGQGTQRVGMGKELFENSTFAQKCWKKADEILGFPLSKIAFEGPANELVKTTRAQPAILVDSYIRQKLLEQKGILPHKIKIVAGHSLGEYTALVAAGVLSIEDAILLVKFRSEYMEEACRKNPGGMIAVKLGEMDKRLLNIMNEFGLEKSIVNSDEQTVLSGGIVNLNEAINFMREKGIVGTLLDVAGAYHSSLMREAEEKYSEKVNATCIKPTETSVIANTTADLIKTPNQIRDELKKQLTRCVLWAKTLKKMPEETSDVSESGILSRMMQKMHEGKGKVEKMKQTIRGTVINFSIWRKNPQPA